MVVRVLKIRIKDNKIVKELKDKMYETREFYNSCLYITRFRYFEFINRTNNLNYEEREIFNLEEWFKDETVWLGKMESYGQDFIDKISIKTNSKLKAKEKQTILRKVCSDWKSYFKGKQESKKSKRRVNLARYKDSLYMTTEFNKQMIKFKSYKKDNCISLTGIDSKIKMPEWLKRESIQAVRLKYRNSYIYLEVIYNKETKSKNNKRDENKVVAIDPGLNTITTLTFNWRKKPILISGKHLKSVNQYYHKQLSILNKEISNAKNNHIKNLLINKKERITEKRNLKVEHELHVISSYIVNLLNKHNVETLIFGHNNQQKDNINLSKKVNQSFVSIPYYKLINILKYKCEENNIEFVIQEESYTSKASFLSNDVIPNYEENSNYTFSGRRVKRGLYKDKNLNQYIHSDVNGSYNIMRKYGINLNELIDEYKRSSNIVEPFGVKLAMN